MAEVKKARMLQAGEIANFLGERAFSPALFGQRTGEDARAPKSHSQTSRFPARAIIIPSPPA